MSGKCGTFTTWCPIGFRAFLKWESDCLPPKTCEVMVYFNNGLTSTLTKL